jgi:hypothetical protein
VNTLTDIQIFNAALRRIGESKQVSAVDGSDTSKYGLIAADIYYATRDEELRAHIWKFAVKRALLVPAYVLGTGSWGSGATSLTVTGVTIVNFTADTALVSGVDLQSRTLKNCSVTPNPAWIGQNISGPGIPSGTVVQGIDYVAGTIRLSKQVTATAATQAMSLCPILNGWLITTSLNNGNVTPAMPAGIPSTCFISKVTSTGTTVTLTLSNTTTQAGSGVSIVLQPLNAVGTWYMYCEPGDTIRDTDLYVILPNFVYLWPFKVVHQNSFPSRREGGYVYTDLDPGAGNVYAAYVAQVTDTSLYDSLFVDALICMLASKMALPVTQGKTLKDDFLGEYIARIARAQTYNLAEMDIEPDGDPFWVDRELP